MVPHSHKVFILGSGFSASMGLPTLHNLFSELMKLPDRPGYSDKEDTLNAIERLYPYYRNRPSFVYPRFEEFLSRVNEAKAFHLFDKHDWEEKWRSVLRLLTDCLAKKAQEAEQSSLLQAFVQKLQGGDVIITFNWDNLIERTLHSLSRHVNFQSRDTDSITVLKLHGSLNWVDIPPGVSPVESKSVLWLSDHVVCTKDYSYYDIWNVLDAPPFIVPPIFSKHVPEGDFMKKIWHEAFNALIDGECITVIGYSIPKDDLQARNLLSFAYADRIIKRRDDQQALDKLLLVDPDPNVCGRYASEITTDLVYYQACFNEQLLPLVFGK